MQGLSLMPGISVKAGETINQPVSPNAVSAVAVRATGEHMSLGVTDGKIAWTAPTGGDWTVYVVEHIYISGHPSSPFTGAIEDYMDPAATAAYIGFHPPGLLRCHAGIVRQHHPWLSRRRAGLYDSGAAVDAQVLRYLPAVEGLRHSALPGCVGDVGAATTAGSAGDRPPRLRQLPRSRMRKGAPRATTATSTRRCSAMDS